MADKHYLSNYLDSKHYNSIKTGDLLQNIHIMDARTCLKKDSDAFMLNGLLTFASAINSINKNNYSWAFIQCYYSLFYMAESLLATHDLGIYYVNKSPFSIKISEGESFKKISGNSHQVILSLYKDYFNGNSLLCGEIEGVNIIDWFNHKREEINYRKNPMTDPSPPVPIYKYKNDLRNWISTYRDEFLYCFEPTHSYIAFSLRLIDYVIDCYKDRHQRNSFITKGVIDHIKNNMSDSNGPFSLFINDIIQIANRE